MSSDFSIRFAQPGDEPILVDLIGQLAEYEKLAHEAQATPEQIAIHLFGPQQSAEALLAVEQGEVVGFALFFRNFSTFLGRPGLYLEDLFVRPESRGRGYGKALLMTIARIAVQRGCGRLDWAVLDWNEPAIGFYRSLGAKAMDQWTTFRLDGQALQSVAEQADPMLSRVAVEVNQ